MKILNVRLNFFWDNEDDMQEFQLSVPDKVTIDNVEKVLLKEHNYLDTEDTSNTYGANGRNPETLINFICQKYGWAYKEMEYDIDLNFD